MQARTVRTVPTERRPRDGVPSHRVFVDTAEIGAAWTKASQGRRDCLALDLDDPSVAPPVFADLAEVEDGESRRLTWSRQSGRGED